MLGVLRVDQLPAQQAQGRPVVELDVVERVRKDLRQPHEPALHILDEEEMHGPEQEAADGDGDPGERQVVQELMPICGRLEDAEQRRVEIENLVAGTRSLADMREKWPSGGTGRRSIRRTS